MAVPNPIVVGAAGAGVNFPTLDISEKQCLLFMEGVGPGVPQYEHHVLLCRVEGARWVTLDPQLVLSIDDLSAEHEVIPLSRGAPFPVAGRPILAIQSLTDLELSSYRARAIQMSDMLGGGTLPAPASADSSWFFADTAHPRFADEVPAASLVDPRSLRSEGAVGLLKYDDGLGAKWTFVERLRRDDLDKWKTEKRQGAGRDPRLLSAQKPEEGVVLFRSAKVKFDVKAVPEPNIFAGPSAVAEVCSSIASSGHEPPGWVAEFLTTSGLAAKSPFAVAYAYVVHPYG